MIPFSFGKSAFCAGPVDEDWKFYTVQKRNIGISVPNANTGFRAEVPGLNGCKFVLWGQDGIAHALNTAVFDCKFVGHDMAETVADSRKLEYPLAEIGRAATDNQHVIPAPGQLAYAAAVYF